MFDLYELFNAVISGFIIGVAGIIPGLSGAVIAVSLGVYPKLISSVINLRKNLKKSAGFLILFALSALVGVFLFGVMMKPLLENYERSILWLFMGLIIGSMPSFMKEATQRGFKITYLIPMVAAFILGMILTTLTEHELTVSPDSPIMLYVGGAILAIGTVIPGLSSSFLLMQIGMYDKLISSLVGFEWFSMCWIAVGAITLFFATVKLINLAFEKLHGYAHFATFGFLLSTMVGVFPRLEHFTDGFLFIAGALFIYAFEMLTKKKEGE